VTRRRGPILSQSIPNPGTQHVRILRSTVFCNIGIVGTGAMGRGIAQIAAQAGANVYLMDANPDAVEAARRDLEQT